MMGHREKLKTAAEVDAVSKWRHVLCYMGKPRASHSIKKQMSRRVRRVAKTQLREGWGGGNLA